MERLIVFFLLIALCTPVRGSALSREMPQPVRKATFADTIVDALDRLGTWERAWQATVPTPGLSCRSWQVIGPLPKDVATDALVESTWRPFDFSRPLRLGTRDWTWRAMPALDANGVPHILRAEPGATFLLARDVLYAPPAKPPRGDWKFALALGEGVYSEWLPGRNMRCAHSEFPFFTYGANTPKLQPTNQVFAVLRADARGEARLFFDVRWLSDRVHPGSTWQYGDRRFKLQDACEALFPDPIDRHLIGYHKSASLWMHAKNPYSYGFQFVPGYAAAFKAMRLPAGFEEACLHADVTNLVAALGPARAAVADLAATFPDWRARAAAHNAELDAIGRAAAAVETLPDVRARVAAYLALEARRRKVLLDNPVLNAAPLLMAKGQVSLNTNFEGPNVLGQALVLWHPAAPEKGEETIAAFKGAWGGFSDFDIHWNADRILYSDRHHLYEYTVADRRVRTITAAADPEVNHYDACYLPNGRICAVCNACWQTVPCVAARNVGNLHLLDADGANERRITFDQDHNWNPVVAEDGRVLFSRWEYEDTPHYFPRLVMRMNPDGSGQMEHYGSNSYWPNSLFWPIPIPGQPNRFVALVTGHHYASRAGIVCLFDTRRGRHEADGVVQAIPGRGRTVAPVIKDRLVEGIWPLYSAPYPLACGPGNKGAGKYFLASRRLNASAGWDLCLLDVFDNVTPIRPVAVENGRLVSYIGARPFAKRPMPRPIPDRTDPAATNATIYLVDIYRGDGLKDFPRGSIKRLRLGTYEYRYFGNGFTFANAYEGGWDIKKILGEVPVNADGSAIFHVPANTPVFVQPLDADGKAQALMRSWYNAMPGEVGSCVGCHEAQNTIPPVALNAAAHAAPAEIEPVSGPARAFSFEREIQPILSRRCAGCHDARAERETGRPDFRDKRLGRPAENPAKIGWWSWLGTPQYNPHLAKEGEHFSPSYWRLQRYVRRAGLEADYHLLPPAEFEADTSMLVQLLKRGHHGVALTPAEWRLLYTWIDYNVPYYANYSESSLPPNPADVARRVKYDRLYARRENHDEDPVPVPPIPAFEPPKDAPPPPVPAAPMPAVPAGYKPVVRELKLPSGATMRFVQIPGTAYGLGECEVSNAQFAEFDPKHDSRYAEGRDKDRTTRGTPLNRPEQPVCRVTWREAQAFCDWLSRVTGAACALPTEAEWRAGCVGDAAPNIAGAELARWNYGRFEKGHADGVPFAAPVTWGRPNALGLRNMLGNVREWTASVWRRPASDPDDPSVRRMVVKGGGWSDTRREANPDWSWRYADYKSVFDVGFRVKLSFPPAAPDAFEAQRAALLARPRTYIADDDGCDMLYYDRRLPVTEEAFIASRLGHAAGTRLDTLVYTPISAGFGLFTALKAGETLDWTIPYQNTTNAVRAFERAVGKDCLDMAIAFARREKKEIFVGIRFNDNHDAYSPGLFPKWKRDNPDCLFGKKGDKTPRCTWSAVDFENPKVRAYMLKFMRQFFENYDVDGVAYDFNRHFQLFKSVGLGKTEREATATPAQCALMRRFMRALKDLADACGRRRGRPILVLARVYDSVDYLRAAGVDIEGWMDDKSIDMLATGGYFRLNPWHVMAEVAHRHGVKAYASMDESRIGWLPTPFHPYGFLPGRNGDRFAAARIAEAMSEGMDGIFFFNTQNRSLHDWASIDPRATEGVDKEYFAVERGSGGQLPWNYVFDGARYSNYCRLDPWKPQPVAPGAAYPFVISVGDDFAAPAARARPPKVTATALMNYTTRADVRLAVNGVDAPLAAFASDNTTNGVFTFDVPAACLKRGRNEFRLQAPADAVPTNAAGKILFVDFKLGIAYSRP